MSFSQFFALAKESSFNLLKMYEKAPDQTLITFGILLLLILIILFFIYRAVKINMALKLIKNIQNAKTYEEYDEKLTSLIKEFPKRGEKVAYALNESKVDIYSLISKLMIPSISIKEKIRRYLLLSKNFEKLSTASKKYNNSELTNYFFKKSKDLVEKKLAFEIENYYKNTNFDLDELENINAVVKYANKAQKIDSILEAMKNELKKFSFAYNSDLYKLIEKMDIQNGKQIYEYCKNRVDELFNSGEKEVSINILEYLFETEKNQKVYDYISNLKLKGYLQQLYTLYFDKKEDINLDLAFIANPLKIDSDYKDYLDNSLTSNWRDEEHIKFLSKAKGVLDVLGHEEFRSIIQRIETLEIEKKNQEKIQEAINIAKRAESIALEAKGLKEPINIK